MTDISVKELDEQVEKCFKLREAYYKLKKESSEKYKEMQDLQLTIGDILESLGKDSYKSRYGTLSFKYDESFRVPQDDLNRGMFFEYLKSVGVYDNLISVNSQTLNSFAKAQMELADANGEIDFQIPGIVKTEPRMKFNMRK